MKPRTDVWLPPTLDFEDACAGSDRLAQRNLLRYWWTWCLIERYDIRLACDFGCGSGYGARIMVEQHPRLVVHALDDNEVALAIARQEYLVEGQTEYRQIDLDMDWLGHFHNVSPQLVVAFDIFEQLQSRDTFLLNLTHLLPEGGIFLLSPHGPAWSKNTTSLYVDPRRVAYTRDDILDLLRRFFHEVLTPEQADFPSRDFLEQHWNTSKHEPRLGDELIACRGPIRKGST